MSTTKKYIATQGVGKFKAGQEVSGFSAERIKTFLKEGVIVDMADAEEEMTDEQKEAAEQAELAKAAQDKKEAAQADKETAANKKTAK